MRLCIRGRHDSLLLIGFTAALLLIFERSVQYGVDVARDIERIHGVALLPALFILTTMFMFHEVAKRREATTEAAAAAAEATTARARTVELENLMRFGHALAGALSTEALKETIWQHLPTLASQAPVWVVLRADAGWERLTDVGGLRWDAGALERTADALTQAGYEHRSADGIEHDGYVCFPMGAGGQTIGIVGIAVADSSFEVRRRLSAAAAFLSVAVNNVRLFAEVRANGFRDELTGCYNRTHTLEILQAEAARSRRTNAPLTVVMFDVDNFKAINDQHGHGGGDAVLGSIGARLRESLRKSDVRCRYGGDEFLIVLPDTNSEGAARVAEWVRARLEQLNVCGAAGQLVPVTVSVGVATMQNALESVNGLIDRADRALYQAKGAGRNCVRVDSSLRASAKRGGSLHAIPLPNA